MSNTKTRNGAIDLMRLVFCIGILFRHVVAALPDGTSFILPRSALSVEFFFLVSGYLMVVSAKRYLSAGPKLSVGMATAGYMKKKVNSLMPVAVIAPILSFVVMQCTKGVTPVVFIKKALLEIWRPLLLVEAGFGATNEIWYLSAMLLVMLALYPVLIKHFDLFVRVIAPLTGVFTIGWLYANEGSLLGPSEYLGGLVYKGLIRALGEICLGAALYPAVQCLQKPELTKLAKCLITLFECGCFAFTVLLMGQNEGRYDFVALLLTVCLVTFLFSHQGILSDALDNGFCAFCGKFSLYLYLCNNWVGKSIKNVYVRLVQQGRFGLGTDLTADRNLNLILFFCCSLIVSCAMFLLCEFLRKHKDQIFGFFKKLFVK